MNTEGIELEATYTGKTFAALLGELKKNKKGPVLFWNTFNSRELKLKEVLKLN